MKWLLLLQLTTALALSPHPFLGQRLNARQSPLAFAGRMPRDKDNLENKEEWEPTPCDPEEARLTVIQITDVYTLETLASVKTLVEEAKAKSKGSKVIAMMTGDFLAPYLLSSVDRGYGMMNALAKIPIDYICWGNHEVRILAVMQRRILSIFEMRYLILSTNRTRTSSFFRRIFLIKLYVGMFANSLALG
jgi:2',3'-cyclic-nucleotide 2'-phosphodiesterase (5'-nucleotidase family)